MPKEMSLLIKGAMHDNADGSNRLFEIAMLSPGDSVELVPEPKNKHDPNAIAIYSARGYQIGYVSAERCVLIGSKLRSGADVSSIFQERTADGGIVRVNLVGEAPTLPKAAQPANQSVWDEHADPDYGFYPDEVPSEY